jgi:hypothetical protein
MNQVIDELAGGDRRSIGQANKVAAQVLENPALFESVFEELLSDDPVLRMRCADVIEKVTRARPEFLAPYKRRLLREIAKIDQQEVRWHVAQVFSRLELTRAERRAAVEILTGYLDDKSKIVKTFSMQALADIAEQDAMLKPAIVTLLESLTETGSPAMKSRGRKLLAKLRRT